MAAHSEQFPNQSVSASMFPGLNFLIVDDEPLALRRLQLLCQRLAGSTGIDSIAVAGGGDEAMARIREAAPDLLMLDVDMPGLSGMDVANLCQKMDPPPQIIFTTAHRKYAVQAFRLEAVDYLLKPVKKDMLEEALQRATKRFDSGAVSKPDQASNSLWVQDNDSSVQIRVSDIKYIEAERDYMRLCLANRHYLLHQPMHVLEQKLPRDMFLRIHRSTIVRLDYIASVRRKGRRRYVQLHDGYEANIGPSYLAQVLDEFAT